MTGLIFSFPAITWNSWGIWRQNTSKHAQGTGRLEDREIGRPRRPGDWETRRPGDWETRRLGVLPGQGKYLCMSDFGHLIQHNLCYLTWRLTHRRHCLCVCVCVCLCAHVCTYILVYVYVFEGVETESWCWVSIFLNHSPPYSFEVGSLTNLEFLVQLDCLTGSPRDFSVFRPSVLGFQAWPATPHSLHGWQGSGLGSW